MRSLDLKLTAIREEKNKGSKKFILFVCKITGRSIKRTRIFLRIQISTARRNRQILNCPNVQKAI